MYHNEERIFTVGEYDNFKVVSVISNSTGEKCDNIQVKLYYKDTCLETKSITLDSDSSCEVTFYTENLQFENSEILYTVAE